MTISLPMKRGAIAVLLILAFVLQATSSVLAGTTGSITGTVLDASTKQPVPGVRVTAVSPSQTTSTASDASGRYAFVSLAPDTYTISTTPTGTYDLGSVSGITVQADQSLTVPISAPKRLQRIGGTTSRAANDLIKPGTTADVYAVTAAQQAAFAGVGGGGGLNNAYSAIATVPGVYVPANQSGYYQTIHIRGGDYDQVGYELDGIPVNRSFDNYPSGSASSLGQQELQVYTGASPANSEGQGLAGYINQVIRTGTYPGFRTADLGVGGPAFYHKGSIEFGGASSNRNFSYYLAAGGYNQDFRYVNQFNGVNEGQQYGGVLVQCAYGASGVTQAQAPSCFNRNGQPWTDPQGNVYGYLLAPYNAYYASTVRVHDTVANLHFGIPHKNGNRDDVQVLYYNNDIQTPTYSATNDLYGPSGAYAILDGVPSWSDGYQYTGQLGKALPATANGQTLVQPYLFPDSPITRNVGGPLNPEQRDTNVNTQSVLKVQYQRNFGSNAFLRLYGYTYYSDWLMNAPQGSYSNFIGGPSPDYELSSHTRGFSGTFTDQLSSAHLLSLQGSYTTARSVRDNNTQMFNGGGARSYFAPLVQQGPGAMSGICYALPAAGTAATPTSCERNDSNPNVPAQPPPTVLTFSNVYNNGVPSVAGLTCGGQPCQFIAAENGAYATYNGVKPKFMAFSLTDNYRPNDRLTVNLGLRLDSFGFTGGDTSGPTRDFFYNAYNQANCVSTAPGSSPVRKTGLGLGIGDPCSAASTGGTTYVSPNITNQSGGSATFTILQPRIGATYSLNPETVLRFSYGKYAEAPNAAYEQYNVLQQDFPDYATPKFYKYGFTTPFHGVRPPVSFNTDFSLEKRLHGTDVSFKLTPFLRKTQDQIQNFYLDQQSGFVSGLNVGRQTSQGVELQLNKGDFSRNGFSGQLSFTYTNSYIQFNRLANGGTILDPINNDITAYNALTKAGGGAACYTAAGAADAACTAGSIANPYYLAPAQPLFDANAKYVPYSIFPAGIGSSSDSFEVPYVTTLVLNYKRNRLAITPSFQFLAGNRFGAPETVAGIDPTAGCGVLAGTTASDPRYQYGPQAGSPYDAASCAGRLNAIPNPFTGHFDNLGAFRNPSQFLANLQLSYQASSRVTLVANMVNIVNTCFGGSKTSFTYDTSNQICAYGSNSSQGGVAPVGNVYNPGANIQPVVGYPYQPSYGAVNVNSNSTRLPFSLFLSAQVKF